MKRHIALILVAIMIFALCFTSCDNAGTTESTQSNENTGTRDTAATATTPPADITGKIAGITTPSHILIWKALKSNIWMEPPIL